ncbi:hypothetical protein ACFXHA_05235 [Nocardia sp. NPDC059240]|uniref:hypothetical protein n=1 Tax=Nocardia sp. NPDC059240 TaxID=3346786 RepID=UPI0036AABF9A
MSLTVRTFLLSADGSWDGVGEVLDTPEGVDISAGFESWRTEVWGSETMRSLDARLFPVLADLSRPRAALIVMPDEIPELLRECRMVRRWLVEVDPRDPDEAFFAGHALGILDRLANIEIAAGRALGVGGGVLIW